MNKFQPNKPLDGLTLERMLVELVDGNGVGSHCDCIIHGPSVTSLSQQKLDPTMIGNMPRLPHP